MDLIPILIVEDDEAHALLIRWIFEEDCSGWRVDHASTIGEARRWMESRPGQRFLVISDYMLPDGTGLDLTDGALRPDEMKFPLIIITGVGSEKLAVQSLKSGALDYVVKGDDLRHLPEAARKAVLEWNRIEERRNAESDLIGYINGLEESSANPDEFMDKIAQYLEVSLKDDRRSDESLIMKFRNKAALWGYDGTAGAERARPGMSEALDLLSKDGLEGAMMMVDLELDKDPRSWEAQSARADILYIQERYFESIEACNRALEINPQNALAWNTKGNALYRLDRYDQAIECYNRAIEISPLFPKSWYNKKLALEVQLRRSMSRISVRQPAGQSASQPSRHASRKRGSGNGRSDDGSDDDRGDGSLRATVGRAR